MAEPFAALVPVILAGGSGTRLWPVSRADFPKHLVELFGAELLFQATARRALAVAPPDRVMTVAAAGQAVLIRRQLEALDPALLRHLVLEPAARNTAAAVAVAALRAEAAFGCDSVLWVCPSDHLIKDRDALLEALARALAAATDGALVTFGITPSRPETGYGWIEPGETGQAVCRVRRFIEKPPRELAQRLMAEGGHLWNSGMIVFRADVMLEELEHWAPDILKAVRAALPTADGGLEPAAYAKAPAQPIDKAVMERSTRVAVVPCDPQWSDVGSWHAIWELMEKDEADNARSGETVLVGAAGNLVRAEKRVVALAGVAGLAVIETADAVLVANRQDSEAVRQVVDVLAGRGRPEATTHAREVRPWGQFTVLHEGKGFKVKEVVVDPGRALTLQFHPGRDETWVVVEGAGCVELDGGAVTLEAGRSLRVPRGARHRLANPGPSLLRLIEVGWGEALADEATVRLEP